MKNIIKKFGIAAMVVAIGFSMAACPNPGGGDGGNSTPTTSIVSGVQVYNWDGSTPFNGSAGLTTYTDSKDFSYVNGSGGSITDYVPNSSVKVTDGKLTLTLGTPKESILAVFSEQLPSGITFNPSTTKACPPLGWFYTFDDSLALECYKKYESSSPRKYVKAFFVYVDRDVIINGTGSETYESSYTTTMTFTNCSLKKGWNYLIGTVNNNDSSDTTNYTTSQSLSDFTWVVY